LNWEERELRKTAATKNKEKEGNENRWKGKISQEMRHIKDRKE
jgi:hypothetical protein